MDSETGRGARAARVPFAAARREVGFANALSGFVCRRGSLGEPPTAARGPRALPKRREHPDPG